MSKKIRCKFIPAKKSARNTSATNKTQPYPVISVNRISKPDQVETWVIAKQMDLHFEFGDRILAVQGTVCVMIEPETAAGTFVLSVDKINPNSHTLKKELEINEETTKKITRKPMVVAKDIGNADDVSGLMAR